MRHVAAGVAGGGTAESLDIIQASETQQGGFPGAAGHRVRQQGDRRGCRELADAFRSQAARLDHIVQGDIRRPFAALELEDVAIGQQGRHGGDHRVHIASGVVPEVDDDPLGVQMLLEKIEHRMDVERIADLHARMRRQDDMEDISVQDACLRRLFGIGGRILDRSAEEGMLSAGHLARFFHAGTGLFHRRDGLCLSQHLFLFECPLRCVGIQGVAVQQADAVAHIAFRRALVVEGTGSERRSQHCGQQIGDRLFHSRFHSANILKNRIFVML